MKPDLERLPGIIARVDAAIAALPGLTFGNADRWGEARRNAVADLVAELTQPVKFGGESATIVNDSSGSRVVIAGIRAHSTTGEIGALRNWQAGARRALAAREGRR